MHRMDHVDSLSLRYNVYRADNHQLQPWKKPSDFRSTSRRGESQQPVTTRFCQGIGVCYPSILVVEPYVLFQSLPEEPKR